MAAYASLVSLTNTLEQILSHPHLSISFDKTQIQSLVEKIVLLQQFLETYSHGISTQLLETQIASAAHAAEDAVESHVADQILAGSDSPFLLDEAVMEAIDAVKNNVMKAIDQGDLQAYPTPASPARSPTIEKSSMVGFDDYLIRLMDKLTGPQPSLQVVPVVGMGGIGKTTLARSTFEAPLIRQHFDIRCWVTVSQNYSVRNLLLELLSCIVDNTDIFLAMEEHQLGEQFHKRLWGRRYLIILDDIWDTKFCENMMIFCPDNSNGSRFVVTTRLSTVALNLSRSYLAISFLDEDQSWILFCKKVFGNQDCPIELVNAGKRIVENCKGLPLSIVVIGGFLRNSARSQEFWEVVATDTNSVLNSKGEEQCMDILYLSYTHLPAHLKPCFLYMGVFPEDEEVRVSQLTKLWVAEGFLKPKEPQSLEEVGEGYLTDLVSRNLILVSGLGSNGKIKSCSLHDLVRELCLKVGEKEKFICAMKSLDTSRAINKERRVVIHESVPEHQVFATGSAPIIRSLICKGHWRQRLSLTLLRVLHVVDDGFVESDYTCVNLRCIDRRFVWYVEEKVTSTGWHLPALYTPKKISTFWNLQIISIEGCQKQELALSDIWEMPQVRHLKVDICKISDPPQNDVVLHNLQTLSGVENFRLSEEVCKRIPNIKKLSGVYTDPRQSSHYFLHNVLQGGVYTDARQRSHYCLHNVGRLHQLRSLNLCFDNLPLWRDVLQDITLPSSLEKLSLYGCKLHWEDLSMFGSLPNLQVLKLEFEAVTGREWNPVEGEFCCLKFLKLSVCTGLGEWNADSCHFPVIESIFLEALSELDAIPWGVGESPTLKLIRLKDCTVACAMSAMEILVEQESYNEELQLEVQFGLQAKMVSFKQMLEQEGLGSNNLTTLCK